VLLCGSCLGLAAAETGRIEGRVTKDGAGVGAVVVLISELKVTEVTDEDGKFVFERLPPGTYTLLLTLGDNNTSRQLIVMAGRTAQLDVEVDWDVGVHEKVTVTAGAARAAKIVDAPAAVTEIPQEQIEQKAATGQVPKLLEFTPGAEVTQSGLYDFNFNTRGFNSSLNRRVSTYIDGRDVSVVLLGAQEWASIAGSLDDVSQLEFQRGPSAALYGANASSGVINITTKAPRDTMGTLVRLTAGELDTRNVDFRWAGDLGSGVFAKITAGLNQSGDFTVSRNPDGPDNTPGTGDDLTAPEYSRFCPEIGFTNCLPEERTLVIQQDDDIRYGSLRFDKYVTKDGVLTFEGGLSKNSGPVAQTGIGRVQILDAKRPFYRIAWGSPRWNAIAHYSKRTGDQVNLTKALDKQIEVNGGEFDLGKLYTNDVRYGAEVQANWNFASDKVRFVVGGAYTKETVDSQDPNTGLQTVVYEPIDANREAVFSQVDWRATRKFKFVFAGRMDWSTLHDPQFSPKAAVVYSVDPKNSIRLTYNEAFQVANYSEFFLHALINFFPIGPFADQVCGAVDCGLDPYLIEGVFLPIIAAGNDDLALEKTRSFELGYSGLLANRVFVTVDYYRSRNENFITDLIPQVGTILGNLEGCIPERILAGSDPNADPRTRCPVNSDYLPWVSTPEAESTLLLPNLTVAQAIRNFVQRSVGGEILIGEEDDDPLGFRMANDLDGKSPVIVGRTYTNVGLVDTQGVDFGVQYFVTRKVSLQASYSWFDFEIIDADEEINKYLLPNTPRNKVSFSASYSGTRWKASVGARWVEGFEWSAGIFQGQVPAYTTGDIAASYGFNEHVRLGLNVANFTDDVHYEAFGGDLLSRRGLLNLSFLF